jgi:serine/threonine-protein kinase
MSPSHSPSDTLAQPDPQQDLSGRQLGDYRLLRRIGRGAMAEVYLAEQLSLGRQVAFKVLKRQLAADATYIKRFQNEARAAAALVHANIVQIYEVGHIHVGPQGDVHFIAQEYVAGQNLRQLLSRQGPLDARLTSVIMRQVAAALHRAAQRGIVHRDIKPENIMLSAAGEVKVADFGLSRIAGDGELNLTQVGITMGTPLYMSPEQAEGKALDPRSDLYSLGVTCYHMLSGRPPFDGETALAVAVQHVRTPPQRLETLRPDLPGGLCRIVHKLLEKQPDERYADAAQLLQDLRGLASDDLGEEWTKTFDDWNTAELAALADARVAATQQLDALMKSAALMHRPARHSWTWLLLVIGLAAFVAGAALAWFGREPYLLGEAGQAPPTVERKENAEAQYWHAVALDRPEAYQAVWQYFPQSRQVGLAKQQLVRFYLRKDNFAAHAQDALALAAELANSDATEVRLRAFGLAAQVVAYDTLGQKQQAAAKMQDLLPLRDNLDAQMRAQIDTIAGVEP